MCEESTINILNSDTNCVIECTLSPDVKMLVPVQLELDVLSKAAAVVVPQRAGVAYMEEESRLSDAV